MNGVTPMRMISLTATLVALTFAGEAAAAPFKIAIINIQRAITEVEQGKAAKDKLKGSLAQKQKDLNVKQEELRKLKDKYESQRLLMKDADRRKMEQELQKRLIELQGYLAQGQQRLARMEAEVMRDIIMKVRAIAAKVAKKEGYGLVLAEEATVYVQQEHDITNQVIRLFNKQHPRKK